MSRPASRAASRPPSRAASVASSCRVPRVASNGNTAPHVSQLGHAATHVSGDLAVTLADCEQLIRQGVVGLPGAVTRTGHPVITFPNSSRWDEKPLWFND